MTRFETLYANVSFEMCFQMKFSKWGTTANEAFDWGRNMMGLSSHQWASLMALHANSHGRVVKYSWFGPKYLSNMYLKIIANHETYPDAKGDLVFPGTYKCPTPDIPEGAVKEKRWGW